MARDGGAAVVGAALAVGAGALWWRRRAATAGPAPELAPPVTPTGSPFALGRPVPVAVHALVSSGWSRARRHGPHRALDILVPLRTPVQAVADGEIIRVQPMDVGDAGRWVGVRHAAGLVSRYLHLSALRVVVGQHVGRGDVLGWSGDSGNSQVPHLHFDLHVPVAMLPTVEAAIGRPRPTWGPELDGYGCAIPGEPFVPVDAYRADVIRDAQRAGVPLRDAARRQASVRFLPPAEPRNGNLVYRAVGEPGERYPDWVRDLKGKSGVYVIRQGGDTVYVGESHTDKLYETLTRHFQIVRHEAQEVPMT